VAVMLVPAVLAVSRGARPSHVAHFRGALEEPAEDARLLASAARLKSAAAGGPLFVIGPRAGFLYLASGLRNPTPFDFPAMTSVGRNGTARLIAQLGDGELPQVCVGHDRAGLYYFGPVVSFVTARFEPGQDVGLCRVYRERKGGS
jgi:hypothetical protein